MPGRGRILDQRGYDRALFLEFIDANSNSVQHTPAPRAASSSPRPRNRTAVTGAPNKQVPVRDASAATARRGSERLCLSHSPEYLNKEIGRFWEKMVYDRGTVQPGAAMTLKEMGPAIGASSPALFVGSPQIEDLVPGAVKETVIGKPYQARSVLGRCAAPPLPRLW